MWNESGSHILKRNKKTQPNRLHKAINHKTTSCHLDEVVRTSQRLQPGDHPKNWIELIMIEEEKDTIDPKRKVFCRKKTTLPFQA